MTKVFVYGTLKCGHGNHRLLATEGAKFLQPDLTKDKYLMTRAGIPFVYKDVVGHETYKIRGELYEVDETVLARLDRLEGHPEWYCREEIELESGETAYLYFMKGHRQHGFDRTVVRRGEMIVPAVDGVQEY